MSRTTIDILVSVPRPCAVLDVAQHVDRGPISLEGLCLHQGIPPEYMTEVVEELLAAGILKDRSMPRSGYVLAKAPSQVRFGEVVRALRTSVTRLRLGRDREAFGEEEVSLAWTAWDLATQFVERVVTLRHARADHGCGPPAQAPGESEPLA